MPDRDGGSKRIDDLITFFQEDGWAPTFVTTQPTESSPYVDRLRQRGVPVYHGELSFFEALVTAVTFDLAVLCFWPTGELFLPILRRKSPFTRVIIDSVDLHFLRHARRVTTGAVAESVLLDSRYGDQVVGELNAYQAADAVLTVSPNEAEWINSLLGNPNCAFSVPLSDEFPDPKRRFEDRNGSLFIGSFRHGPNIDAVEWLCRDVIRRLPQSLRDAHPTYIVGDGMDDHVRSFGLGMPDVRMVGWVPSLAPYLSAARVSVLPLLSGAGTKQKMIQCLMGGTAVVSTSIGAEGFDLKDGTHVLIADYAHTFAEKLEEALTNRALWQRLAKNGRRRIVASHGREVARATLAKVVAVVMRQPPKASILPMADLGTHHARLVYQYEAGRPSTDTERHERRAARRLESRPLVIQENGTGQVSESFDSERAEPDVKLIALYLPQFHPIPENDTWWGQGFTEWTNVRKAKPLFEGHDQPKLPGYLGYYDLRDPGVRAEQASLAARYGIYGFCYYHYWFSGKRLLERPFDEVLRSREPDLPFCLCWANEPWSRRWDGSEHDVLMPQSYSAEDDLAHIRALLPAIADSRAIRVDGSALLLIYQGWALPDPARMTDTWRTEVLRAGLGGLHLLAVETGWDAGWDATTVGFDGKVLFQPQFTMLRETPRATIAEYPDLQVYDYETAWRHLANAPEVSYLRYDTVFPAWDNTARQGERGTVIHNSSPGSFERWLERMVECARNGPGGESLVFINAWNEWAEGCYLEPDERHGLEYLEAVHRVMTRSRVGQWTSSASTGAASVG